MFRNPTCLYRLTSKKINFLTRNIKTKIDESKKIKYTDTINLPKTPFPARLNQIQKAEVEKSIRTLHLSKLYDWQREHLSASKEYILHDGPPYANGELHMGHAVNKIIKDIILKQNIINKTRVHYIPGWDCHGLPIELKAIGTAATAQQNPLEIRQKAKKFAVNAIKKQKESFESWGVTGSWNDEKQTYRTFDKDYIKNQLKIFFEMYQKGLIFRDVKPIYFSPSSSSALAEAELEYDENFTSPSLYFRSELINFNEELKVFALIWTTTPWTLPANQGICINSELKYGIVKIQNDHYVVCIDAIENLKNELECDVEFVKEINTELLLNSNYQHPICNEINSIYDAQHAKADKGTGLVHTAPSHGHDDFLVFLNKKIPLKCLVNENGCFNENSPTFLHNKNVLEDGNDAVIEHVKSLNNIVKLKSLKHSYPIDWRTKKPVIILASEQWFINTEKLKNKAINELEKVKIYPEKSSKSSKSVLQVQLEKRPYWCISRQRSWGVPIPVLYDENKKAILNEKLINHWLNLVEETGGIDFWWQKSVDELTPTDFTGNYTKGNDILDIWFDSGISWSKVLENNSKIADLYLEGVDQFTGWFQSSLMTSIAVRDIAPYKNIFVHGFTVDENGKKMSKSLGNVINPESIVKKYGIDVMRFWIAAHSTPHALIPVSNKLIEDTASNLVKIRATLKYLLGVVDRNDGNIEEEKLLHLDKFILHKTSEFVKNSKKFYENFQFNKITAISNNYINTELSSFYLHLIKDRLYCGTDEENKMLKGVLRECYYGLCKTLWPIIPFMIEESWSYIDNKSFYQAELNERIYDYQDSVKLVENALEIKRNVCTLISGANSLKQNVIISGNDQQINDLIPLHPSLDTPINDSELCEILQVSSITLRNSSQFEIQIKETQEELCPRCRRFTIDNSSVCNRCENILKFKK